MKPKSSSAALLVKGLLNSGKFPAMSDFLRKLALN